MNPPFAWYGSKRRWASKIWDRLGRPDVYAEPFAGSLAVLLANPTPCRREVVCDTDGSLCNFWRALRSDPEAVAHWADWPTIHDDLTARHRWLVAWHGEHAERLREDPDYFDAKAAGWWVWGLSLWIGGGWATVASEKRSLPHDKRPHMYDGGIGGGRGVCAQVEDPGGMGRRPALGGRPGGGQGVSAQRADVPDKVPTCGGRPGGGRGVMAQRRPRGDGSMPMISRAVGGRSVSAQRVAVPRGDGSMPSVKDSLTGRGVQVVTNTGRLVPWFEALAERLERVIVLNRGWESAVTDTVLGQSKSHGECSVGILLDPPYVTDGRHAKLYESDVIGSSTRVANEAWQWALEHGERYRIAYCAHEGDFDVPTGWDVDTAGFKGVGRQDRREERRDMVLFSPACLRERRLF